MSMKKLILVLLAAIPSAISSNSQVTDYTDVVLTAADYPTNFWYVDGKKILRNMPEFKVLDATEYGCRIVFYKDGELNYDHDCFFIGFNGYSDRTYKCDKMVVKADEPFEYKTTLGGHRTIPAYRYATLNEVATVAQRMVDLKQEKFHSLTNRIFYINEKQAAYNTAHKVKTPNGYIVYVTNLVSTNLFLQVTNSNK